MIKYVYLLLIILNISFGFEIRSSEREDYSRVVFQVQDSTDIDLIQIENTIVIKINEPYEKGKFNVNLPQIQNVEIYQTDDRSKSIVYIQTISNPSIKSFTLKGPKRLVLDIKKNPQDYAKYTKPEITIKDKSEKKKNSLDYTDLNKILSSIMNDKDESTDTDFYFDFKGKKKVIVIDPGHGGQDPGATVGELKEKDINLKIAKMLKSYFERDPRFVVYLTREDDTFIPLYDRTIIAIKKNADLFISIHTNASENPNLNGSYVYTLNLRGATSKLARMVEERENKAVLNVVKVSSNPNVNKIVADMAISHTMTEGLNFAKFVEVNFKKTIDETEFKRIDSANFAVLKIPSIPSILFETAFITNERDYRLLSDDTFLDKVAKTLYKSTKDYFFKYKNLVFKGE